MSKKEKWFWAIFVMLLVVLIILMSRRDGDAATYYYRADGGAASYTAATGGCDVVANTMTLTVGNAGSYTAGDLHKLCDDGGTFRESLIPPSSGDATGVITYEAETGDTPIISGADTFVFTGPDGNGEYTATCTTEANVVIKDGVRLVEGTVASLAASEWGWLTNVLYLGSDPSGSVVDAGQRDFPIDIDDTNYITVSGLTIEGANSGGVYIRGGATGSSSNNTIQNSTIKNCGSSGITVKGANDASEFSDYNTIDSNTIFNIGDLGNLLGNDIGCDLNCRRLTISNNHLYGDGVNFGADGITFNDPKSSGHTISGNTIHGHGENAIDFKEVYESAGSEGETDVYDNELYDEDNSLILVQAGSKYINIYSNILRDSHSGILIHDPGGAAPDGEEGYLDIYNNEIYNMNSYGISDHSGDPTGSNNVYNNTIANTGLTGTGTSDTAIVVSAPNWVIKNNIIYKPGEARDDLGSQTWGIRFENTTGHDVDYNLLLHNDGDTGRVLYFWGVNYTLAQMIANTDHSDNDVEADPQFINTANGNFRLTAASPAIDAGVNIGYGNDIGAYETTPVVAVTRSTVWGSHPISKSFATTTTTTVPAVGGVGTFLDNTVGAFLDNTVGGFLDN